MTAEINSIKSFFNSIQVHSSPVWLESCVNWCKSETLPANHTPADLQAKVYEQWLLLDLRDVEVSALPPNLGTKKNFTLNGNFCLQMMQVLDISKPKQWQLNKIRNAHSLTKSTQQDADVVGTAKRMLQLTLTDGVQEVEAMEYRPVACLSINLTPGVKIRILGPVVVRRGRLMLEDKNVKVLGGEVEELLVSHAAENVLARALNLPINPTPVAIEEKLFVVEKEEKNEGYVNNLKAGKIQKPPTLPPRVEIPIEEEELINQEFEMLMEIENDFNREVEDRSAIKRPKLSLDDDDDDVFNNIDLDAHLEQVERDLKTEANVVTIAKLTEIQRNVTKGVFKIRAKFKGVEEKLILQDGEYKIVIKVEDSTGELDVSVHSSVISELIECTPSEMELKDYADKMEALTKLRERLITLDAVVKVEIDKTKRPVIINVF